VCGVRPADAFAALADELGARPDVHSGTGFGSNPGLRTGRKIFAILVDDELVVKLPADRCRALVQAGRARPFEVGGRRMREWICVPDDIDIWPELAAEAREFVAAGAAESV
jgi:hypothetical protein